MAVITCAVWLAMLSLMTYDRTLGGGYVFVYPVLIMDDKNAAAFHFGF